MMPAQIAAQRARPSPKKHQAKATRFRRAGKNVLRAESRAAQGPPLPRPNSVPSWRVMRDWRNTESGTLTTGIKSTQRKGQNHFRTSMVAFPHFRACGTHIRTLLLPWE
jgi:hypothetical protein